VKFKKAHFQEMREGLPIIENAYKGGGSLGAKNKFTLNHVPKRCSLLNVVTVQEASGQSVQVARSVIPRGEI
jgi:hypothetical protein